MSSVQYDQHDIEIAGGHRKLHSWAPRSACPHSVIAICHGYAEHMGRYDELATELANDGSLVVGVDVHGHGLSSGSRGVIADLSAEATLISNAVSRSIQERSGQSRLPVGLFGHSLGGLVALLSARRLVESVQTLVLSSPAIGNWSGPAVLLEREDLRDREMSPSQLTPDREAQRRYAEDPLVWRGGFSLQTLHAMSRGLDEIRRLGTCRVKEAAGLWIHGENDRLVPVHESRAGIYAIDCVWECDVVTGGRHEVLHDSAREPHVQRVRRFFQAHLNPDRLS